MAISLTTASEDVADLVLRVEQHGDEGGALEGVDGDEVVEAGGELGREDRVGDGAHLEMILRQGWERQRRTREARRGTRWTRRKSGRSFLVRRHHLAGEAFCEEVPSLRLCRFRVTVSVLLEGKGEGVTSGVGEGSWGEAEPMGVDAEDDLGRADLDDGVVGGVEGRGLRRRSVGGRPRRSRVRRGGRRSSRGCGRETITQDRLNCDLQGGKIAVDDLPYGLQIDRIVLMAKHVS